MAGSLDGQSTFVTYNRQKRDCGIEGFWREIEHQEGPHRDRRRSVRRAQQINKLDHVADIGE